MPYLLSLGAIQAHPLATESEQCSYSCKDARLACRPTFVFSISGQVGFRSALHHLKHCHSSACSALRKSVMHGFTHKARWLIEENSYIGCNTAQSLLYTSKKAHVTHDVFEDLAQHLSRCPKESCAQLRRAVLLTVRSTLSTAVEPGALSPAS